MAREAEKAHKLLKLYQATEKLCWETEVQAIKVHYNDGSTLLIDRSFVGWKDSDEATTYNTH